MYCHLHRLASFNYSFLFKLLIGVVCVLFSATITAQEPQPDVRPLAVGERIERQVLRQELHVYTVQLKRGQVLRASIVEKGADVGVLIIRTTDNQKVSAAANFGYGFMRESLTFMPEQDGAYSLVILAQQVTDANVEAKYELITSLNDHVTEQDIQRLQAEKLLEEGMQLFTSDDRKNQLLAPAKWEESSRLWRRLGENYWAEIAAANVGIAYVKTENFGEAVPYLSGALKYFEGAQYEPETGAMSIVLGTLYMVIADNEKATTYLNKALKISRSLGDKRSETQILNLLSANRLGEAKNSVNYADEVAKARARKDKFTEAAIWEQAISRYATDDSIDEGERRAFFAKTAQEAIPLAREIKNREYEMKILFWLGVGYDDTATDSDDEAEEKADEAKSFDYLMQALLLSEVTSNQQIQLLVYFGMNVFYDDDIDRLAIFFGKKAINSIQSLRQNLKSADKEIQQNYARKVEEGYGLVAEDLFFEGRLAEAQQVINLSRDQEYFDFTRNQSQPAANLVLTAREAENEQLFNREVKRIIAKYANRLELDYRQATDELKATFRQLESKFKVPASEKDINRTVPDTTDMQSALRELDAKSSTKHVTIYFVTDVDEILLLTPDSIRAFGGGRTFEEINNDLLNARAQSAISKEQADEKLSAPVGQWTDERILEFLEVLSSPDVDPRPLGSLIYRRIFKTRELVNGKATNTTLEAALAQYKPDVLLWSLSGNIRYIPMAALYDAEKKQYLVEKYQNAVFTRARKERFLIAPKTWTQSLAFGTSAAHNATSLPGVTEELSNIFGNAATGQKGLLSGRVFLNAAFTRQAFLTAMQIKPSLIHIASHFSFQPGDARNSFLLLGDGNKFSLYDMQQYPNLFAGVDLLTLSACETAAQQPGANGKEIDGFAELAQRLGASSVIATLWKVADDGTSQLMTEFYRLHLAQPDAPKSAILRQAQLNLLNGESTAGKGLTGNVPRGADIIGTNDLNRNVPFTPPAKAPLAHPYYWAPFVLFGSTR